MSGTRDNSRVFRHRDILTTAILKSHQQWWRNDKNLLRKEGQASACSEPARSTVYGEPVQVVLSLRDISPSRNQERDSSEHQAARVACS